MLSILSLAILLIAFGIGGLLGSSVLSARLLAIYFLFVGPSVLFVVFSQVNQRASGEAFLFSFTLLVVASVYIVVARKLLPARSREQGD